MDAHIAEASEVAAVVQRFDDAWQRGDIDTLMSLIADDCVYDASIGPGPGTRYAGKAEVRRGFVEMLAYDEAGNPPARLVMVDGSRALALWTVRHTTATGEIVTVRGCDIFEVHSGLIRGKDAFRKSLA